MEAATKEPVIWRILGPERSAKQCDRTGARPEGYNTSSPSSSARSWSSVRHALRRMPSNLISCNQSLLRGGRLRGRMAWRVQL